VHVHTIRYLNLLCLFPLPLPPSPALPLPSFFPFCLYLTMYVILGVVFEGQLSIFWLFSKNKDLFSQFFETGSCYVAQTSLKIRILLPQSPEYWDYRHVPPSLARMYTYIFWHQHLNLVSHLLRRSSYPWATLPALLLWGVFSR
jgi:hypothetical protein